MTAFVTGGAGFIGSALVRSLIDDGAGRVVTIDSLTYAGNPANLAAVEGNPRHRLAVADITDSAAMAALFAEERPSVVYHLAAESHVDRSIDGPAVFVRTNVVGTEVLLEAALEYWRALDFAAAARFRFLQVSTDEVFGSLGPDGTFTEDSPSDPSSPYAASKAAGDHLARAFHRTYGLPVLVSNGSNTYGPYQFPEKLIPLMILRGAAGRPLPVYGDGANVRDWIHVDDHAAALRRIAEAGEPGRRYLVGSRTERSNRDIVGAICRLLDARLPAGAPHEKLIEFVADRPGHDRRYALAPDALERELGWRPRHDLATGLAATVDWYLDRDEWIAGAQRRYRQERLGLAQRASS
ncbi:dTDP-glucose 4,6-dehydratase [Oceanibacterium hippocampi]|uniref:dTDP-glucose 4,6-dehydratase n=1 Tax=Oceanibacterium hippocampi TaxID=745714 RepID=A0A1Y5U0H6_9PROT|nr:dTDP-glucose 4,6-dehydratase [Oceanibacterium hippocampi]SLN73559.1 dTDP-glucose 4,6-dehydratase 2 [Oceanibacterium hippocampi]